jgi:hypothetical protein
MKENQLHSRSVLHVNLSLKLERKVERGRKRFIQKYLRKIYRFSEIFLGLKIKNINEKK